MLSCALAADPDALMCDMAETYHIVDCSALPLKTYAALAAGLGSDSRIMRKLSGARLSKAETLLAIIADGIRTLVWLKTKDGHKGRNRPRSILEELQKAPARETDGPVGFASGEDFEAARRRIVAEVI